MDNRIIIVLLLAAAALLISAGCLQQEKPVPTPEPTAIPTTEPTAPPTPVPTTKASLEPGPTDTLPPQWPLSVTVEKSGLYSRTIITKFDGGKGLMYVSRMDVRVTMADGSVKTDGIDKPAMGDTVEIMGSGGTDRVEVMLRMANGNTYKIIDQLMPFKGR